MEEHKDSSILTNKKVLFIEDDVFLGEIFLRHMLDIKINARLITTGEGIIDSIKKDIPEFIILDILLPGVNGLEILEKIRQDQAISSIPVIVVSNTDKTEDREKIKSLNAKFMLKALASPNNIIEEMTRIVKGAK